MLLDEHRSTTGPSTLEPPGDITIRRFEMRRRIMDSAKHRFARHGYEQVSLDDVACDTDLDRDDFKRYFPDKSSLLAAISAEGWKDLLPHLSSIAANSISAHSALLGIFAKLNGVLSQDEDLVRLLLLEGRCPDPEGGGLGFTSGYRRFLQLCRDLVLRGQRDGSFRARHHAQVAASMLVGAFEGMLRDRMVAVQERGASIYTGAYLMSALDTLIYSLKT